MSDMDADWDRMLEREERDSAQSKRVRIVGSHPHRGASGTVRDELPMVQGMWRVDMDDSHTDGCYAGPEHLRALSRDEDPYA